MTDGSEVEAMAERLKRIYLSVPKTRGVDKLDGWREIARFLLAYKND